MARFRVVRAFLLALCAATTAVQAAPLSLHTALDRALASQPALRALDSTQASLEAEVDNAQQAPPLVVGASLENALGTSAMSGLQGAELTLSLASVLERGDKRARRVDVARRALDAVELQRAAARLDVLAEVARRYLDSAAAQALIGIANRDVALRTHALAVASKRVSDGGAPVAVRLAADVELTRATGSLTTAQRSHRTAARRLTVLWGEPVADLDLDISGLSSVPKVPEYTTLRSRLSDTPELRVFATEARLREARVQLARSARVADVDWEVGVRRLQESSDFALMGSISIPLGSAARATPGIRAAEAELARLEFERESEARQLEATLAEVYGRLETSAAQFHLLTDALLPRLREAETAAADAYRRGALSYLEWSQLQSDTITAERERLAASVDAWRALIELQRLTGDSFTDVLVPVEATP